jgi:hypothetical protein
MSPEPGTSAGERHADEQDARTAPGATAGQAGEHSPAPLTSLSALLGDSLAGGAACTADGTCD